MPNRGIIVVGASSGGIEALTQVVRGLPSNLPASIFVVQHVAAHSGNYLAEMLARETPLEAKTAEDREPIRRGVIYVAAADRHLLIDHEQVFLSQGPRENRTRPAIDPLFRSAALSHGPAVIGVILSGSLDDGTAGLQAVKRAGGVAVVQDPASALTPDMPRSASDNVEVDHRLPATEIGPVLGQLAAEEPSPAGGVGDLSDLRAEHGVIRRETGSIDTATRLGELVPASCPDCGGPLWEMAGDFPRFRCHTGHAFTARHLIAGLGEAEEQSLWVALRVMEERARMLRRLARQDSERGHSLSADVFGEKADEADQHVRRLRGLLGDD